MYLLNSFILGLNLRQHSNLFFLSIEIFSQFSYDILTVFQLIFILDFLILQYLILYFQFPYGINQQILLHFHFAIGVQHLQILNLCILSLYLNIFIFDIFVQFLNIVSILFHVSLILFADVNETGPTTHPQLIDQQTPFLHDIGIFCHDFLVHHFHIVMVIQQLLMASQQFLIILFKLIILILLQLQQLFLLGRL